MDAENFKRIALGRRKFVVKDMSLSNGKLFTFFVILCIVVCFNLVFHYCTEEFLCKYETAVLQIALLLYLIHGKPYFVCKSLYQKQIYYVVCFNEVKRLGNATKLGCKVKNNFFLAC